MSALAWDGGRGKNLEEVRSYRRKTRWRYSRARRLPVKVKELGQKPILPWPPAKPPKSTKAAWWIQIRPKISLRAEGSLNVSQEKATNENHPQFYDKFATRKYTTMNKLTISQKALHEKERKAKETIPSVKHPKRDNVFSKSRDNREDRDTRQTKTDQSKTFPHAV